MLRWLVRLSLVSAVISAVWFVIPVFRSAETQAKKQHERFLGYVAKRDWARFYLAVSPDYKDAWEQSRDEALAAAREALTSFIIVNFDWKMESVSRDGKTATLTGTIHMSGTGATGSTMIIDHVNKIEKPWTFVWRKDGWKPSDWHLISVATPEVSL